MAAFRQSLGDSAAGVRLSGRFGGSTQAYTDDQGRFRVRWTPHSVVQGMAYDYPVPGYRVPMVNILRLVEIRGGGVL